MDQQKQQMQAIPQQEIVHMIQEFLGCLNYPNTKATLAKEISNKGCEKNSRKDSQERQLMQEENLMTQNNQNSKQEPEISVQVDHENQVLSSATQKMQQSQPQNLISTQQPGWKLSQAKYYSKFATFSEIISFLETSANHRQLAQTDLREKQPTNTNNQVLENSVNCKPTLLHLFSAFDTISRVKEFVLPVNRNLSMEPKFAKAPRLLEASSKENFLCIVDENSTLLLLNLQQRTLSQVLKPAQTQTITSIKWLKTGTMLATGMSSGKLLIYAISQGRSLDKLTTLNPHLNEITCMFCNKDYLYTCSSDYTISRIYIRFWKVEWSTKLKGIGLRAITKIEHKKLKDLVIGISEDGGELVMVDEVTGLVATLFRVRREHAAECRKVCERKDEKLSKSTIVRNCFISDVLVNIENDTLIISVSVDPLSNESWLRLNYKNLKTPFIPSSIAHDHDAPKNKGKLTPNIHMTLTHRSQVLAITTNSNMIFFVRVKNWRTLHEHAAEKTVAFGGLTSTRRHPEADDLTLLFTASLDRNSSSVLPPLHSNTNGNTSKNADPQKQPILSVHNVSNGNIQNFYCYKGELKVIRSDSARSRPFMPAGLGFPSSAQGFLELLQTIRENYQAFV